MNYSIPVKKNLISCFFLLFLAQASFSQGEKLSQENLDALEEKIQLEMGKKQLEIDQKVAAQDQLIQEAKREVEEGKKNLWWWIGAIGIGTGVSVVILGGFLVSFYRNIAKIKADALAYADKAIEAAIDQKAEEKIAKMLKSGAFVDIISGKEEALQAAINLHGLEQQVLKDVNIYCVSATKKESKELEEILKRYDISAEYHEASLNEEGLITDTPSVKNLLKALKKYPNTAVLINNRGQEHPYGDPREVGASLYALSDIIPSSSKMMILGFGVVSQNRLGADKWIRTSFANLDAQIKGNLLRLLMMKE